MRQIKETKEPVVQAVNYELLEIIERSEVVAILRQRLGSRSTI